jgi:ATP-dependent DNA ligase
VTGSSPTFDLPVTTEPMEAKSAEALPSELGRWQYEPKWDGFRCLAFKSAGHVDLRAKSGKPLGRFFPEVLALLAQLPVERFVIDGELVIEIEGHLSFDALQMRLHPAESRIRKLSALTPARLMTFDMLASPDGKSLLEVPLIERRKALDDFGEKHCQPGRLILSPYTREFAQAERWLRDFGEGATDGVVAKLLCGTYEIGARAMIKVKRLRTADCVVGGFRYESNSREVGSLLLGLFDDQGKLNHVGYTSTITNDERPTLTTRLEALRAPPGFTGKAPGGPSRWSTERSGEWEPVDAKLVVEVRFDHVTGDRFRHGTKLIRWRPDKAPNQCTMAQMTPRSAEIDPPH